MPPSRDTVCALRWWDRDRQVQHEVVVIHHKTKTGGRVCGTFHREGRHHIDILKRCPLQLLGRQDWWRGKGGTWRIWRLRKGGNIPSWVLKRGSCLEMVCWGWICKMFENLKNLHELSRGERLQRNAPVSSLRATVKIPCTEQLTTAPDDLLSVLSINYFWALILHREASMYKITGLTSCVAGASRKVGRENQSKPHSDLPWHMSTMVLESGHVPQAPQELRGARVTMGLDLGSRCFWRRALSSEDGRVHERVQHSPAGGGMPEVSLPCRILVWHRDQTLYSTQTAETSEGDHLRELLVSVFWVCSSVCFSRHSCVLESLGVHVKIEIPRLSCRDSKSGFMWGVRMWHVNNSNQAVQIQLPEDHSPGYDT